MSAANVGKGKFAVRPFGDNFSIVRTTGRVGHVAHVVTAEDAAFIVHACNSFDAMREALQNARSQLIALGGKPQQHSCAIHVACLKQIDEALAHAAPAPANR